MTRRWLECILSRTMLCNVNYDNGLWYADMSRVSREKWCTKKLMCSLVNWTLIYPIPSDLNADVLDFQPTRRMIWVIICIIYLHNLAISQSHKTKYEYIRHRKWRRQQWYVPSFAAGEDSGLYWFPTHHLLYLIILLNHGTNYVCI